VTARRAVPCIEFLYALDRHSVNGNNPYPLDLRGFIRRLQRMLDAVASIRLGLPPAALNGKPASRCWD